MEPTLRIRHNPAPNWDKNLRKTAIRSTDFLSLCRYRVPQNVLPPLLCTKVITLLSLKPLPARQKCCQTVFCMPSLASWSRCRRRAGLNASPCTFLSPLLTILWHKRENQAELRSPETPTIINIKKFPQTSQLPWRKHWRVPLPSIVINVPLFAWCSTTY